MLDTVQPKTIVDQLAPKVDAFAKGLPAGYSVGIEGNYAAQQAATKRIAMLSLISLMLVFAILYTRYHSVVLSLIVMVNVPLALIGSIVALWIVGGTLSLATMRTTLASLQAHRRAR